MDTSDRIKAWLDSLDNRIDAVAVDPEAVKQDSFLRHAFALAFPPENLPDQIKLRAEGNASQFQHIAAAHRPYYIASTSEARKINLTNGEERTHSTLTLKLQDLSGLVQNLKKHGLIRKGTKPGSGARPQARPKKRRGKHAKGLHAVLEYRSKLRAEIANLERLEQQADERGDTALAKNYREDRNRSTQLFESSEGILVDD